MNKYLIKDEFSSTDESAISFEGFLLKRRGRNGPQSFATAFISNDEFSGTVESVISNTLHG